jgi:hypothetical protein
MFSTFNISFIGDTELLTLLNELHQADTVDNLSGYTKTSQQYAAAETKWKSRQAANDRNWATGREQLYNKYVQFEGISSPCYQCGASQMPIVRCQHCCTYLCCKCDEVVHTLQVMHSRLTILDGLRSNLLPMEFLSSDGTCFKKGTGVFKLFTGFQIVIITLNRCLSQPIQAN